MARYKFGVYLRLSSEDKDKMESNSIVNQRSLINYYLEDKKDINIYKNYVDDGFTGTDTNRPGFQEMLKDIYSGKINGVIVKDLSRLGRNYIEVGNFFDNIIPRFKVRFISVNDNVDSLKDPKYMDSLEIPLKNLMNENYSYDTSKKIRSTFKANKKNGKFIGGIAPYGYLKDENDNHKFVIDKEAAEIVKKIFNMVIEGKSRQEIVSKLNCQHILTPSRYFKERLKLNLGNISKAWNVKILDEILKDETYIGTLVQGKRERISHKVHNIVRVAEEDWIKVVNHHKPIIKEKIFFQVQDILYKRNVRVTKNGKFHKYSGKLKCADCGCNLYRKSKNSDIYFYYCGTYLRTRNCSKHYITEKEIDDITLTMLNNQIDIFCNLNDEIEKYFSKSTCDYNIELKKINKIELEKRVRKYQKLLDNIRDDYLNNYISKEDFEVYKEEYLYELNKANIEIAEINKSKISDFDFNWLKNIRKIGQLEKIDKNIIDEFIDVIWVKEDKILKVCFNYNNEYEQLIRYIKSQKV